MEETIKNIIHGCRRGDRKAQLAFYNRYAARLYGSCYRIIGNSAEAEEAMQDSILKILTAISKDESDIEYFDTWTMKIALRTAIDYVRRKSPELEELKEYDLAVASETNDEMSDESMEYSVESIKKACNTLAPGYRVILSLYLFEGYDMEEISEIMHIKPSTVRTQYMRGKQKLIKIIKEEK